MSRVLIAILFLVFNISICAQKIFLLDDNYVIKLPEPTLGLENVKSFKKSERRNLRQYSFFNYGEDYEKNTQNLMNKIAQKETYPLLVSIVKNSDKKRDLKFYANNLKNSYSNDPNFIYKISEPECYNNDLFEYCLLRGQSERKGTNEIRYIYQAIIITKNKQTEFVIQCNYKNKDDEEIINEITNSITRTVSLQLEK
jgi:hypothetical protein